MGGHTFVPPRYARSMVPFTACIDADTVGLMTTRRGLAASSTSAVRTCTGEATTQHGHGRRLALRLAGLLSRQAPSSWIVTLPVTSRLLRI